MNMSIPISRFVGRSDIIRNNISDISDEMILTKLERYAADGAFLNMGRVCDTNLTGNDYQSGIGLVTTIGYGLIDILGQDVDVISQTSPKVQRYNTIFDWLDKLYKAYSPYFPLGVKLGDDQRTNNTIYWPLFPKILLDYYFNRNSEQILNIQAFMRHLYKNDTYRFDYNSVSDTITMTSPTRVFVDGFYVSEWGRYNAIASYNHYGIAHFWVPISLFWYMLEPDVFNRLFVNELRDDLKKVIKLINDDGKDTTRSGTNNVYFNKYKPIYKKLKLCT